MVIGVVTEVITDAVTEAVNETVNDAVPTQRVRYFFINIWPATAAMSHTRNFQGNVDRFSGARNSLKPQTMPPGMPNQTGDQ